jgi:hypothetical protein
VAEVRLLLPCWVRWSVASPEPQPRKGTTRKTGVEITLRLDSGRTIAIVQEDKGEQFVVGERVRLLESRWPGAGQPLMAGT